MARKPNSSKRNSSEPTLDGLVDAMLAVAEAEGWSGLTMASVARQAGVPLSAALALAPGKLQLLKAYTRRIDAVVVAGTAAPADDESPRDRLFDVLMRRFDAMQPDRAALQRIKAGLCRDPLGAACLLPRMMGAMALMLECAGIGSGGPAGRLRAKGLAGVYGATLRAWFRDDSPDLSKTMSALDHALARAERAARVLWPGRDASTSG
jgi:ubiquinone biosynthesis protein COQ9